MAVLANGMSSRLGFNLEAMLLSRRHQVETVALLFILSFLLSLARPTNPLWRGCTWSYGTVRAVTLTKCVMRCAHVTHGSLFEPS